MANKMSPARLLSGLLVTLVVWGASATAANGQTGAHVPVGAQAGTLAGQKIDAPVFSVSKAPPPADFLAPMEENRATDKTASPSTAKAGAKTPAPGAVPQTVCKRWVVADVVALAQPFMLNRLGAAMPNGLIFALANDVVNDANGNAVLKEYKRPRPIVLRVNKGDCLRINFSNRITPYPSNQPNTPKQPNTPEVSVHAQGMQLVKTISDDGSFVGRNPNSLVDLGQSHTYELFAAEEGTFLLYSEGDSSTMGNHLQLGMFGAVNVQPQDGEWYRSQVTEEDLRLVTSGQTTAGQPIIKP